MRKSDNKKYYKKRNYTIFVNSKKNKKIFFSYLIFGG